MQCQLSLYVSACVEARLDSPVEWRATDKQTVRSFVGMAVHKQPISIKRY